MGEVKQTNFRIDQDTAAAFRKFCEDNGMNQAQGFDHVMQVVELDRAKTADTECAVIAKEREMQAQLREADKENARLATLLE